MAGTKPRMTKQHARAAALPGKPCFPTGATRSKRHPDNGAAGSAGALFCARALVTLAAAVSKYAQEGC